MIVGRGCCAASLRGKNRVSLEHFTPPLMPSSAPVRPLIAARRTSGSYVPVKAVATAHPVAQPALPPSLSFASSAWKLARAPPWKASCVLAICCQIYYVAGDGKKKERKERKDRPSKKAITNDVSFRAARLITSSSRRSRGGERGERASTTNEPNESERKGDEEGRKRKERRKEGVPLTLLDSIFPHQRRKVDDQRECNYFFANI